MSRVTLAAMTLEELLAREGLTGSPDELMAWAQRRSHQLVSELEPGDELSGLLRPSGAEPVPAAPRRPRTPPPPVPTPAPPSEGKPSTLSMNGLGEGSRAAEAGVPEPHADEVLESGDVELLEDDDLELVDEDEQMAEWQSALSSARADDDERSVLEGPTGVSLVETPANRGDSEQREEERLESST